MLRNPSINNDFFEASELQIDLSIFSNKAKPLIGLDISSSAVKMVELSGSEKEGFRVERYAVEPLPKDIVSDGNIVNLEVAAETVRRAWKRLSTSTRQVAMALHCTSDTWSHWR